MKKAQHTIFYAIERTIKQYRKYAITQINQQYPNITLDQSMLLRKLLENPEASQTELGNFLFKDVASISRMINLLVKKKLVERKAVKNNRRQNKLSVNQEGIDMMDNIKEIVKDNRHKALVGISKEELEACKQTLDKIYNNLNK